MRSQIVIISTGFMDTVNDANPGGAVTNIASTTGDGFSGQLGGRTEYSERDIRSAAVDLLGGEYQYVQFKATATKAPAKGLLAFWDVASMPGYVVTNDEPTGVSLIAGITLNAVTKGNYGFIQVSGRATCQVAAAAGTAAAVGVPMFATADGSATVNCLASTATTISPAELGQFVGTAETAPTNGSLTVVQLRGLTRRA